jgi:hypothetical protein
LDSVEEDLDIIFFYCVDEFYNEYSPVSYRRTDALYEGYKFTRGNNGLSFEFETSPSFIPNYHRASPAYIYDLTYLHGYHGGHINGGDTEAFSNLSIPAMIGEPIDDRIENKFKEYRDSKKFQSYFDQNFIANVHEAIAKYGLAGLF